MSSKAQQKGMVDISDKKVTKRKAAASCEVRLSKAAFKVLASQKAPKGDVLETAKIAGIMAAKLTPQIIPLCHPLEIQKVGVSFRLAKKTSTVKIVSEVVSQGRTGVEMEALCAVSAAALTVYDMLKYKDKGIVITETKLLRKSGGKSGTYIRKGS